MKNRSRHPLFRAYSTVFARSSGDSLILSLEDLARSYRERATELDPDTRLAQGDSPSDVAVRIATVRQSFRLIRDVMGDRTEVWLQPWTSDEAPPRFVHVSGVAADEITEAPAPRDPSGPRPWSVKPVPGFRSSASAEPATSRATRPTRRHVATLRTRVEPRVDARGAAVGRSDREAIYEDLISPPRPLLGRYLVQQGLITLSQLIDAVHWQRRQRPPVGRIAVQWGLLETSDVVRLLRTKGSKTPFCRHAVDEGALQTFQRVAVLAKQREMQRPIGEYFVEKSLLSADTIAEMAERARAARAAAR
jgi:hypothetical protein